MRYNGNLAYELEFEQRSIRTEQKVKEQKQNIKKKARAESIVRHKAVAACSVVLALCAGFMLSRNVTAYESKKNVESLQKELNQLNEYSSQKAFELDRSIDLESVEEYAKKNLNMVRPEKYQTVYVNIKQDDVTEVTAREVEGISALLGIFRGEN